MSSFYFPQNLNEYEKAIKEWSSVRKQLNDKVVATKLGEQVIEESQAKNPQTKLLQDIASSLTKQVPVIDDATRLEKPGEFKTEKLIDKVIEIPNRINDIVDLLTVTEPNSVPALIIKRLKSLATTIRNSSNKQIKEMIQNNKITDQIIFTLQDLQTDVILGSLNRKIILKDIESYLNNNDYLDNNDFYDNLIDKFQNSGFNDTTIDILLNKIIMPIIDNNDGTELNEEDKKGLIDMISNEIGIKTDMEKISKSVDKKMKLLESKIDEVGIDTKDLIDTMEERKVVDEKIVSDVENIVNNMHKSTQIKETLIDEINKYKTKSSKGSSPNPRDKQELKDVIKTSVSELNDILPEEEKVKPNLIKDVTSINKVFNDNVNKSFIDKYKDTIIKKPLFNEVFKAPFREKIEDYDIDWNTIKTDEKGNFGFLIKGTDKYLNINNILKDINAPITVYDKKGDKVFNKKVVFEGGEDFYETISDRGYLNLIFLPWKAITNLRRRGKGTYQHHQLLPLINYQESDIEYLKDYYKSLNIDLSLDDPNPKIRLAAGDTELASELGIIVPDSVDIRGRPIQQKKSIKIRENSKPRKVPEKRHDSKKNYNYKSKKMPIITEKKSSSSSGSGIMHKYTANHNGKFGDLMIDMPTLHLNHRIKAINGRGITIMDKKTDGDLVDLLTKTRFNPKKVYSEKSVNQFKELVKQSGLPVQQSSGKYSLLNPKIVNKEQIIKIFKNSNDLIERMGVLVGEIEAGNNSQLVHNELMNIIDVLFQKGIIDKKMHKSIYKQYLS